HPTPGRGRSVGRRVRGPTGRRVAEAVRDQLAPETTGPLRLRRKPYSRRERNAQTPIQGRFAPSSPRTQSRHYVRMDAAEVLAEAGRRLTADLRTRFPGI